MKRYSFPIAFLLGALAVIWVAAAVATSHPLVLGMAAIIGGVYVFGAIELRQYRATTTALSQALTQIPTDLQNLNDWLITLPSGLHNPVRQRVEGERTGLPGPALTPYLVGLLVMLGMLGTFLGMVVTLNGAVFALEGSSSVAGIRAAFSEPIKGLGLAFGTSVAGVAASAMLGLMVALARRERAGADRLRGWQEMEAWSRGLRGRIAVFMGRGPPSACRQSRCLGCAGWSCCGFSLVPASGGLGFSLHRESPCLRSRSDCRGLPCPWRFFWGHLRRLVA